MADGSLLYNGDPLVVDSAEKPRARRYRCRQHAGEFTVKRLLLTPRLTLQPMNASRRRFILIPTSWISLASSRISSTAEGDVLMFARRCEQLLCQL